MLRIDSRAIHLFGLGIFIAFAIFFLFNSNLLLSAQGEDSAFQFSSESDYWPTDGWKTAAPESQGMRSDVLADLFTEFQNIRGEIYSLLVIRNGYIVVEANRRDINTYTVLYSGTKSISSAIFGIALDRKIIKSIDQPLTDHFTQFWRDNDSFYNNKVTLKHLLSMSSGIEWPEIQTPYDHPENPVYQMKLSSSWIDFILSKPVIEQPGLKFNYNSGGSHLLLAVLHQAGLDVADFAHNNFFRPLGIQRNQYYWTQDPDNIPNGAYGLSLRPRDMGKVGHLFLKGGLWEGTQLISKSWVEDSSRSQIKMNWGGKIANDYGYQWYIQPFGFHSMGYGGQYIFVIPTLDLVVVFTSDLAKPELEIPIEIVKNYIMPAVESTKMIPPNDKGLTRLKSEIERFNSQ